MARADESAGDANYRVESDLNCDSRFRQVGQQKHNKTYMYIKQAHTHKPSIYSILSKVDLVSRDW